MENQKFVATLTVKELVEVIKTVVVENTKQTERSTLKGQTLRGIRELANHIGCGIAKAQELKNKGLVPYSQYGNRILFNSAEVDKKIAAKLRL